jgi:hypothetical protein
MRHRVSLRIWIGVASLLACSHTAAADETTEFYVYQDSGFKQNHYYPTGRMGDVADIIINESWPEEPVSGNTCIRIDYKNGASQGQKWAGVYWQNPAHNWGGIAGGYDLTPYSKITFWARGALGGEIVSAFKVGGIQGKFSDSDVASIAMIKLTNNWKMYAIDLAERDLSSISGGFLVAFNIGENPKGLTLYLDEIKYER